uniref:NADH dehydrogenase subunit 4L n=1 Tax=Corynosoma villosum TaxID=141829 RepID=UPI002E7A3943|nr:NADH dehydrogenase subunit 4L [Corynosoma villosum]WPN89821.1 NADH dehydrogenase subunit 4L [Corynosoma villosum]
MGLLFMVFVGVMVIKSIGLISLLVSLEGIIFMFLVCLVGGLFTYWNCEVLLFLGVCVSVVVVSVVLSTYVAGLRGFGVNNLCVSSLGVW